MKKEIFTVIISALHYELKQDQTIGDCYGWSHKEYFIRLEIPHTLSKMREKTLDKIHDIMSNSTTYISQVMYDIKHSNDYTS